MQPFPHEPLYPASQAVPPQPVAPLPRPGAAPPRSRHMMWLGGGLLVGAFVGFIAGSLVGAERVKEEYRNPFRTVPAEAKSAAPKAGTSNSAAPDPRPPSGAKILSKLALPSAREALHKMTASDKVVVNVASVGRGDSGAELHLSVQNHSDCAIAAIEGIAYGFDPDGQSTTMNAGGEHFVAFSLKELKLEPGKTSVESFPLHHIELANVALAQIDRATCQDGRSFGR